MPCSTLPWQASEHSACSTEYGCVAAQASQSTMTLRWPLIHEVLSLKPASSSGCGLRRPQIIALQLLCTPGLHAEVLPSTSATLCAALQPALCAETPQIQCSCSSCCHQLRGARLLLKSWCHAHYMLKTGEVHVTLACGAHSTPPLLEAALATALHAPAKQPAPIQGCPCQKHQQTSRSSCCPPGMQGFPSRLPNHYPPGTQGFPSRLPNHSPSAAICAPHAGTEAPPLLPGSRPVGRALPKRDRQRSLDRGRASVRLVQASSVSSPLPRIAHCLEGQLSSLQLGHHAVLHWLRDAGEDGLEVILQGKRKGKGGKESTMAPRLACEGSQALRPARTAGSRQALVMYEQSHASFHACSRAARCALRLAAQLAAVQINLGSVALQGLADMQRVGSSDLPADTSWAITQSCSWEGGGVSMSLVSVTLQHLTRYTDGLAAAVDQAERRSRPRRRFCRQPSSSSMHGVTHSAVGWQRRMQGQQSSMRRAHTPDQETHPACMLQR